MRRNVWVQHEIYGGEVTLIGIVTSEIQPKPEQASLRV